MPPPRDLVSYSKAEQARRQFFLPKSIYIDETLARTPIEVIDILKDEAELKEALGDGEWYDFGWVTLKNPQHRWELVYFAFKFCLFAAIATVALILIGYPEGKSFYSDTKSFIPRSAIDPILRLEVRFPIFGPRAALEMNWADAAGKVVINDDFEVDEQKSGYSWFHGITCRYLTVNMLYNDHGQLIGKDYLFDLGKMPDGHAFQVHAKYYPEGKEASLVNDPIVIPEPKRKKTAEAESSDMMLLHSGYQIYNRHATIPFGSATTKWLRRPQ